MHKEHDRFRLQDVAEVLVGATMLAFPVASTEEIWNFGRDLSGLNVAVIGILSLVILAWFGYHKHYNSSLKIHRSEFFFRVFATYGLTLIVSASILLLVNQFPLGSEPAVAVKRMILVAGPASFLGTVVDSLR